MKKIVFVLSSGLVNAGVPRVLKDIFDGFKDDYIFDFIVQSEEDSFYDHFFENNGCTIYRLRNYSHFSTIKSFLYRVILRPLEIYRILHKKDYSVIHCCNGFNGGVDCFVAKMCGIQQRIVHAHGSYKRLNSRLGRLSDELSLKLIKYYSTAKIAVSDKAGRTIFGDSDFSIIYNAIDSSLLGLPRQNHDGINLIQVGYYSDLKNQLFSLSVLSLLRHAGVDATLTFIGFSQQGKEEYFERMKSYVARNDLINCVTFLPHDTPKPSVFPIIDFLLLPSKSEGLPLVVLEGQAAGIKCLVSDAVTEEVNIGLTKFLSITNPSRWVKIIQNNEFTGKLDTQKVQAFSEITFRNSIGHLYKTDNDK